MGHRMKSPACMGFVYELFSVGGDSIGGMGARNPDSEGTAERSTKGKA